MIMMICALLFLISSRTEEPISPEKTASESVSEEKQQTTVVTSESLDMDNIKDIAIFNGNVHVKDPDGDMWSDKMVVHFDPDSQELKKLISTGEKVVIVTRGKRSVSREAVYTAHDGKIVLTGNPRITQGRNTYGADKITIFKNQERTIFEPKARLILYNEEGAETVGEIL